MEDSTWEAKLGLSERVCRLQVLQRLRITDQQPVAGLASAIPMYV